MNTHPMPYDGTPPDVAAGDPVEIRDAAGDWHPTVARSAARYDYGTAIGRQCWLTVAVDGPRTGAVVNWPAEHVRKAQP